MWKIEFWRRRMCEIKREIQVNDKTEKHKKNTLYYCFLNQSQLRKGFACYVSIHVCILCPKSKEIN